PVHHPRDAHFEQPNRLATPRPPSTQLAYREGPMNRMRRRCWPSTAVSILNHKSIRRGIPRRAEDGLICSASHLRRSLCMTSSTGTISRPRQWDVTIDDIMAESSMPLVLVRTVRQVSRRVVMHSPHERLVLYNILKYLHIFTLDAGFPFVPVGVNFPIEST